MNQKDLTNYFDNEKDNLKIRNTKSAESDENYEKDWKLKGIAEIVLDMKTGFSCNKKYHVKEGVGQLRPNNIGYNGVLDLSHLVYIPEKLMDIDKYSLMKGDVLFNNTNSKELVGRSIVLDTNLTYGFSNHITRMRVNESIVKPEWLSFYINYLWKIGYFNKICRKWIGQAGVSNTLLKDVNLPIPPIEVQNRLISKFRAYLDRLEFIKIKNLQLNNLTERVIHSYIDNIILRIISSGDSFFRLGDLLISQPQYGLTANSSEKKLDYRYIRITDLTNDGYLKNIKKKFVEIPETKFQKFKLEVGDILIARSGSVGRMYLHNEDLEQSVFASYLIRFKMNTEAILPEYLLLYSLSSAYKKFIVKSTKTVAQPNINAKQFSELQIPVPSINEQSKIVEEFRNFRSKVEMSRNHAKSKKSLLGRLNAQIYIKTARNL